MPGRIFPGDVPRLRSGSHKFVALVGNGLARFQIAKGSSEVELTPQSDSGTGELTGLSGELRIDMVDVQHRYEFACQLPK